MIDLHLHTTASDGLCAPGRLVEEAAAAGLTTIAVTDHDTVAGLAPAAERCAAAGLGFVPGIEITAVGFGRDVHVLGYFFDAGDPPLLAFLAQQRESRFARLTAIAGRLAALGVHVDVAPLIAEARRQGGRSVGRPQVARALVAAGHAADTNDAFERWLGVGRPGFVPRSGAPPGDVIEVIHRAGGLASLAHPGVTAVDARIPALVAAGLDAIEAYHSDHDAAACGRYLALARTHGLLVTGGSDYHGDPAHGLAPGAVTLPAPEWEKLSAWPRRSSR